MYCGVKMHLIFKVLATESSLVVFFFNLFETLTAIPVNLKKGVGIIIFSGKITFI